MAVMKRGLPVSGPSDASGRQRVEERKSYAVVKSLIVKPGISNEQAAGVADVPADYVANIRAELKKK
jgi:hypothetical protein